MPDIVRMYDHLKSHIYKNAPEHGQQNIADGQVFRVQGATVTAVHSPGHSYDHMCFVLEEEKAMFTGDNILGIGTSAVEDLGLYMSSLQKMAAKSCTTGYPAHGVTINDLQAKIDKELAQKWRREKQVIRALEHLRDTGENSALTSDVVTSIYGVTVDTDTRKLALEPFIDEVLRKLAGDGRVGFHVRCGRKKWYLMPTTQIGKKGSGFAATRVRVEEVFD